MKRCFQNQYDDEVEEAAEDVDDETVLLTALLRNFFWRMRSWSMICFLENLRTMASIFFALAGVPSRAWTLWLQRARPGPVRLTQALATVEAIGEGAASALVASVIARTDAERREVIFFITERRKEVRDGRILQTVAL